MDNPTSKIPKSMNELNIESSSPFSDSIEINIGERCWPCGGTGKLKAMTMAMTLDGHTTRGNNVLVDCNHCGGRGRK